MLDDVRAFEFYYDAEQSNPKEDPSRIHERLDDLAEREGIAYERTNTADMSRDERQELYRDAVLEIRDGREYHVGNRIFTPSTFGSLRPALVIRYADGDGVDVYPHRNDAIRAGPVGVLDLLDEIDDGSESDRGDYAAIRGLADESSPGDQEADESTGEHVDIEAGRQSDAGAGGIIARLRNRLPL